MAAKLLAYLFVNACSLSMIAYSLPLYLDGQPRDNDRIGQFDFERHLSVS